MAFGGYDAFGDSITFGSVATSIGTNDYVSLLGASAGLTPVNHGVGGHFAMDQEDVIMSKTVAAGSLSSVMLGANEAFNGWGAAASTARTSQFGEILRAETAWLALLNTAKVQGQGGGAGAPVTSGSWTNSYLGSIKATAAATATFTTSGTVAYLVALYDADAPGSFTLATDGGALASYNTAPATTMQTNAGRRYGPRLIRIAGLSSGSHTHVLTWVSGTVYFAWSAGNGGVALNPGPVVLCGTITPQVGLAPAADITRLNAVVTAGVTLLQGDGLGIYLADTFGAITPGTDISGDGIHPNNLGHSNLAAAFITALRTVPFPASPAAVLLCA